jgi:trigger factor
MQSEIREISPVLVEVTVEVPWDRIHKDLNDTYREIGKTARVRGFRPGKVPKNVLKQVYGRQAAAQVTGTLVEQGLMRAVQEHELHIVAQPEMEEPPELEQGKPLTFKAKVEVRPKIDEVATDGLEVWQKPIDIPDEDVDAEIEQLRHQHGEIQVPDPMRAAQEGDLITIDQSTSSSKTTTRTPIFRARPPSSRSRPRSSTRSCCRSSTTSSRKTAVTMQRCSSYG